MKIAVIGATGSIGRLVVQSCLNAGNEVTAFARSSAATELSSERLSIHVGDVMDLGQVEAAIARHDAIIVTLGNKSLTSPIRSRGTLNVVRAMHATGVKRVVCQSTLGTQETWSNLNFFWKRIMFGGLLRLVFRDHEHQEHIVQASGLDWTIVRPSAFVDGVASGGYKVNFPVTDRELDLKISRQDVAD